MAITPRSFFRSPLLLTAACLMWVVTASAAYMFMSPCQSKAPQVRQATVVEYVQPAAPAVSGHGWLGLHLLTMSPQRAAHVGVNYSKGVLVTGVVTHNPAQNSGFATHDVVTHFDGIAVSSAPMLKRRVMLSEPGQRVPVRVMRQGSSLTLYPTLGVRPKSADAKLRRCGMSARR